MGFSIYDQQYIITRNEHAVPTEIKQIVMERTGHEMKTNRIFILPRLSK